MQGFPYLFMQYSTPPSLRFDSFLYYRCIFSLRRKSSNYFGNANEKLSTMRSIIRKCRIFEPCLKAKTPI
jgi:hypothetical protein